MTQEYKVTISGPGLNLERVVPEQVARQIVILALGNQPVASERVASTPKVSGESSDQVSIAEFLTSSDAKRSSDKIAAIGVFLRDHRSIAAFSIADLKKAFEDAAETVPANLPRDVNWTKRLGWIAPKTGERGAYYVTGTGAAAVRGRFPSELLRKTRMARPRKKAKAA